MCLGSSIHGKTLLFKSEELEDSCKTLYTKSSSLSSLSFDEEEEPSSCVIPRKSCLKVKTLAESLSTSTLSPTQEAKSVCFSTLDIHIHALQLGDNPSISSAGPPLTIAWNAETTISLDVDAKEEFRDSPPRSSQDLKIPGMIRYKYLAEEGYSRGEMMEAQVKALRCARQRMATAKKENGRVKLAFTRWFSKNMPQATSKTTRQGCTCNNSQQQEQVVNSTTYPQAITCST